MPITYALDQDRKLIRAEVAGEFTADDMLRCVTDAAVEAKGAGWNVISDHRRISHPATRDQLERLTGRLESMRRHFSGARWAVVTTNVASFGMMRMLQVMAERIPMQLQIFGDYEEAERWVTSRPSAAIPFDTAPPDTAPSDAAPSGDP